MQGVKKPLCASAAIAATCLNALGEGAQPIPVLIQQERKVNSDIAIP